jgi:release factor glutamine methyltransferase
MSRNPGGAPATVSGLLQEGRARMEAAGCDECLLHAEILLGRILGLTPAQLLARGERLVDPAAAASYRAMVARRERREPLQYILGDTEFLGLRLVVTPAVLIPRPETELLVERAAALLPADAPAHVLDLGTGSGNIAVGLAVLRPAAVVTGVDIRPEALVIARRNAETHAPGRVQFFLADMYAALPFHEPFDLVVSNPPYIARADHAALAPEVRDHEPVVATTDQADGLQAIRAVSRAGALHLRARGTLLLEIGFGQADEVSAILADDGFLDLRAHRDYAGINRIMEGRRP